MLGPPPGVGEGVGDGVGVGAGVGVGTGVGVGVGDAQLPFDVHGCPLPGPPLFVAGV